jgi:hypothetical protein
MAENTKVETTRNDRELMWLLRFGMEVLVTLTLLASSLYVILFRHGDPTQQWAVGVVGAIVGYWLHSHTAPHGRRRTG